MQLKTLTIVADKVKCYFTLNLCISIQIYQSLFKFKFSFYKFLFKNLNKKLANTEKYQ